MGRVGRVLAAMACGVFAAVLVAGPAAAHGQDAPVATDYRVTVTAVEPATANVRVRAVEGGARLELTSLSAATVEILGLQGEPFLKLSADGVAENRTSPTLYASRTRRGTGKPPAGVDPTAAPDWHRTSSASIVRWHEARAAGEAPARTWSVPLLLDGRVPAVIRGTVHHVPPPNTAAWWAASLAAAALLTTLGLIRGSSASLGWLLAGLAGLAGGLAIALNTAMAITAATPGSTTELLAQLGTRIWPVIAGLSLIGAGIVAVRRPAGVLALWIAACLVAFYAGIVNGAVFSHTVVAGPTWTRHAAATIIALALGLTGAGALRWYRTLPADLTGQIDRLETTWLARGPGEPGEPGEDVSTSPPRGGHRRSARYPVWRRRDHSQPPPATSTSTTPPSTHHNPPPDP